VGNAELEVANSVLFRLSYLSPALLLAPYLGLSELALFRASDIG